ncbi:MAG: amino acid adenylation domain-containing protein [Anaerolineae bacterium]
MYASVAAPALPKSSGELPPDAASSLVRQYPLADGQQAIWLASQLSPNTAVYHMTMVAHVHAPLAADALGRAFQRIADRHAVLRTTYPIVDGQPVQRIHTSLPIDFGIEDAFDADDAEIDRRIEQFRGRPFDLTRQSIMRIGVFQRAPDRSLIVLVFHHIAVDGWSMRLILDDLRACYTAEVHGVEPDLRPVAHHYTDFVTWQRDLLAGAEGQRLWDFWRQQLAGPLTPLALPFDRPYDASQAYRYQVQSLTLDADLTTRLKALAYTHDTTLFTVLLTAFQVLLRRYTGQDEVLVATPTAARGRSEFRRTVGYFVNPVIVRANFADDPTFTVALNHTHTTVQHALAHRDYPYARLINQLRTAHSAPGAALVDVIFNYQRFERYRHLADFITPALDHAVSTDGPPVEPLTLPMADDQFALNVDVYENEDVLDCTLGYNASLFDSTTIERLLQNYRVLLDGLVTNPDRPVSILSLLTTNELQQVLTDWNSVPRPLEYEALPQWLEAQVVRTPDAIAVQSDRVQLTYAELNQRANQLAHHLLSRGVQADTSIGVALERSVELIVAVLGVLKAGAAYVPIDPQYPAERQAFMLADSNAALLLTHSEVLACLSRSDVEQVCLDRDWPQIATQPTHNPVIDLRGDQLAYVIYTSGSTGQPKGAQITHHNLVHSTQARCEVYEQGVRGLVLVSPVAFDSSVASIFWTLCDGGTLYLPAPGTERDPAMLVQQISQCRPSHWISLPSLYMAVLDHAQPSQLTSLETVIVGGEACPLALIDQHTACVPNARLFNEYGPTEATVWCSVYRCDGQPLGQSVPIGRAIPGVTLYVLDEHRQPVPIGVRGELYIGGQGVGRGYLNRPEMTAEKFSVNPFGEDRLYRTGDLVRYRADGNLEFLGRIDQQVNIRGQRVELGEVEAVLARHVALRAAAVTSWPSAGGAQLAAYIVPIEWPAPLARELRAFLKTQLPDFMLPTTFTSLDVLPLLPNGKVDRRALPQPTTARSAINEFVVARTPIEALVAEVWAEVLGVDVVGVHDNFFELGGHSLLATQVVARLRDAVQIDLPLRAVFEAPTVAELAAQIEERRGTTLTAPPITRIDRSQPLPLSFSQERLWFIDQLSPGNSAYNVSGAMRLKGQLNLAALKRSYQALVQRHEVLRTTFDTLDGRPVQIIAPALTLDVPLIDLRSLPPAEREARLQQLALDEASRPFDLKNGPLMRVCVVQLTDEDYANLVTMHHIVTDAWSNGVAIREFIALYAAYVRGEEPMLPDLPVQCVDFAAWQRQWLQGDELERQLAYWRTQLANVPALELPTDHPRPPLPSYRGGLKSMPLADDVLVALTTLSRESGTTVFMTLLAAFQTLLSRYTAQTDLAVGVPIANRQWLAAENLIGTFVNTLVLRADLGGSPTFREVLARTRDVALQAYAHQDLSFAKLVMELQTDRDTSRSPLFQVMFNVINVPMPTFELPGLTVTPFELDRQGAQFDLTLTVSTIKAMQTITLEYSLDLFVDDTIERMLAEFETLLRGIIADPDRPIATLPLLPESERQRVLSGWNDTALDYERTTLHAAFERQADRTPDAVALIDGAQHVTYRDLEARANQVAHHLRWQGVGAGMPVAISLPRSFDLIAGLLGILKAGGIYVPIDPAAPPERLVFMLQDSRAPIWLTRREIADRYRGNQTQAVCVDTDAEAFARQPIDRGSVPLPPDPLAYLMYTSGSTGTPKGVLGRHWSALNRFNWMWQTYPFAADEVCVQKTYLSFVDSVWEIFGPLLAGVPLVLVPDEVLKDDRRLVQLLADHKVTRLVLVPSLLRILLFAHDDLQHRLPHLKYWISSGETLPLDLAQRFWQVLPDATLINLYGSSEVAADSTYYEVKFDPALRSVPIGRPIANTQVYVLDARQQLVPIGVTGEIVIGGEGVARGYHNRPDLTNEKFIADPFNESLTRRLYRTGDLGRFRADGVLEYLGRADQQVKVRGVRVELGEVEAVLKQHRGVEQAVVVAREDIPGDQQLVAYVVPRDAVVTPVVLRDFVKGHLSEQAQPAAYVMLEALPLTPSGKVDRRALPQPERGALTTTAAYVAPRDLTERQLATIWEEVLHLKPIGVHSNFFELGGHSLLAIELFARIEDIFGQRPPLTTLFQSPTIAQLAAVLCTSGWSNHWSTLVAIQPQGTRVPFFCVHGFGGGVIDYGELARQLGPDRPFYGLQARGMDGGALPHTHIETMAEHYVKALQTIQPHGPYQIGGYCFGGVVAYEMARQLRERGEEVALVAIMEGYAPTRSGAHRLWALPGAMLSFAQNMPYWLRDYLALGRQQVFTRVRMKLTGGARRLTHRPGHPAAIRVEDYVPDVSRIPEIHRKLIEVHLRAMQDYTPRPFDGRVMLFRVRGMSLFRASDPQMGWGRLARGGVEIKMIEGGHNNILEVPYVESLAEQLKAALI